MVTRSSGNGGLQLLPEMAFHVIGEVLRPTETGVVPNGKIGRQRSSGSQPVPALALHIILEELLRGQSPSHAVRSNSVTRRDKGRNRRAL